MIRVILADKRESFLADVSARAVMMETEVEFATMISDLGTIDSVLSGNPGCDFLVVCANLLGDNSLNYDDVITVVYGRNDNDRVIAEEGGFPYLGTFSRSTALLEHLERMDPSAPSTYGGRRLAPSQKPQEKRQNNDNRSRQEPRQDRGERPRRDDRQQNQQGQRPKQSADRPQQSKQNQQPRQKQENARNAQNAQSGQSRNQGERRQGNNRPQQQEQRPQRQQTREERPSRSPQPKPVEAEYEEQRPRCERDGRARLNNDDRQNNRASRRGYEPEETPEYEEDEDYGYNDAPVADEPDDGYYDDQGGNNDGYWDEEEDGAPAEDEESEEEYGSFSEYLDAEEKKNVDSLAEQIESELHPHDNEKTKTVTVYSAKGGVGKTTISSELAAYLSILPHGRGTYRVCIVDYNIDFGNVRTTLGVSAKANNMTLWAADIRDRVKHAKANGEEPPLDYSKDEIEDFLEKVPGSDDFWALLAPMSHEDSMGIGQIELATMLRNIIEFGDFDFVICDTGNNTRDSSITALLMAQYVLLVVTQDVTTTDANDLFLRTLKKMNFDQSKVKLIVNMCSGGTGVTAEEVANYIKYDCIAEFDYDNAVRLANNKGEPLAYRQKHKFTKELQKVVRYVAGVSDEVVAKRRGLFGRRFGGGR